MKHWILMLFLSGSAALGEAVPEAHAIFPEIDMAEAALGQLLFFDPILSGNKSVACATCHHPRFGTSDGVSLGLGDGGIGLGPERVPDPQNSPEKRIARNSPALFNLGAAEFTSLFHDGRLEADTSRPSGIRTPLGADMEAGFASALSAQAMFPVLSNDEMAGHYSENDIARAVRLGIFTGEGGAWSLISARVEAIPAYRRAFDKVIGARAIHFTDIANVLAAFVAFEWRADDSSFDRYLRGGRELSADAMAGMALFYGKAGCSTCHSGQFQTDHRFHAIAMPQIGPGKAAPFERYNRDAGRMRVTGRPEDAYAFRTPSLRNVALTAPYGHSGAYNTLEGVLRHHLDPVQALMAYDRGQALMPEFAADTDFQAMADSGELEAIAAANSLTAIELTVWEFGELLAFLNALTDPVSQTGRLGIPPKVPSGLPVP